MRRKSPPWSRTLKPLSGLQTADVFPNRFLRGWNFHWCQAVWRKVQELGMSTLYSKDRGTHQLFRQLLCLPLLPEEHIIPIFNRLEQKPTTPFLKSLTNYIRSTWIESRMWGPGKWSVLGRAVRTNNDTEAWHNRFQRKARQSNLNMYVLVEHLFYEANQVILQVRLVFDCKLMRYQKKKSKHNQANFFALLESYTAGDL